MNTTPTKQTVSILFAAESVQGTIKIKYGNLEELRIAGGEGTIDGASFDFPSNGDKRLDIDVADANLARGKCASIVTILSESVPVSFFLRDVNAAFPIYVPEHAVIVTTADDHRGYEEIEAAIKATGAESEFDRFEREEEETFENAAKLNRDQPCPTWLGVGRDLRHFRVKLEEPTRTRGYWGLIRPMHHAKNVSFLGLPELPYCFAIGQGSSCRTLITRRLEDGCLPILRSEQIEDDVTYLPTFFATLENGPLGTAPTHGSEWLAAYQATSGHMLFRDTPEGMAEDERKKMERLFEAETLGREDTIVLVVRVIARNDGVVPRYAWFKAPRFDCSPPKDRQFTYDGAKGMSMIDDDFVFSLNRIDSDPMPDEEMAVLLAPGETVTVEFIVPHSPISPERAERLSNLDVDAHLAACENFWRGKLASAATVNVPETAIDERVRAGLLHCDLVTLGKTDEGPLLPTIGWYAPIGSESSPIIQYFDSIGWHEQAERCLDFFLARQRPDGFMQNFNNYQLETGPVLWCLGEHFRYTRDRKWLERVLPNVRKAVDYLMKWIERNRQEEYRELGFYGMIEGKVADCNDFHHSFMLNAVTYLGLKRVAEIYVGIDDDLAALLNEELPIYKRNIRRGFYHALNRAPVFPVGDGSWAPLAPPWVEYTGGISLYADGGLWYSHGAFASRSCLTGPLYLILGEVLDPDEIGTDMLIKTNQQPITRENAALSQPYYCRHDITHLRRGEVKPFLKLYYNQLTGLQDRETYTFWEHFFKVGEHKTHEEAWFLMQTRWMLYLEEGETLSLLKGVPRKWLEDGKTINLKNVASYFGHFDLSVESKLADGTVHASIRFAEPERRPKTIALRIPLPDGRKISECSVGDVDSDSETVTIRDVKPEIDVLLK